MLVAVVACCAVCCRVVMTLTLCCVSMCFFLVESRPYDVDVQHVDIVIFIHILA